jgi:hypothetical protein
MGMPKWIINTEVGEQMILKESMEWYGMDWPYEVDDQSCEQVLKFHFQIMSGEVQ